MTSAERHQRITELFLAASELEADQRRDFLDEHCRDDPALRAEVEAMLAAEDDSSGFLGTPALGDKFSIIAGKAHDAPHPERVGAYTIIEIVAEGGMGVVYLAEQERPRRRVALKVIKPGLASEHMLKRFEYEEQVLGRLQHPGIAQIFEAGIADAGSGPQPFFAMEFIQGQPLTKYAEDHNLGTRQRLVLLAKVCDAVHHAHQKGVVHRDLKPRNIIVDETGQPKILDFGVARATDVDIQHTTVQTDVGQPIGTVPYMSPEQAGGDSDQLDTRSDVYALGVICYELLAGQLPYDLSHKMLHEAVRVIREEEPTPLGIVNSMFRGDLETIISKALEKEKSRRYQSASDLAADLTRYLNDEPIVARPPGSGYLIRKVAKRHRALVTSLAAVFVILLLAVIGVGWQAIVASQQRRLSEQAEKRAQRRFEQVRALAKAFIFDVHDELQSLPGATAARERLLMTALQHLDSLAEEAADDILLQKELGDAYMKVASVLGDPGSPNLGDTQGALENYHKALAIRQTMAAESSDADSILDLAESHRKLADVQARAGQLAQAEQECEKAFELAKRVSGKDPANRRARLEIAAYYKGLGDLKLKSGDTEQSLKLLSTAVGIYDALEDQHGGDSDVTSARHASSYSLGRAQEMAGRTAEALVSFEQAAQLANMLCEAHPDNVRYRRSLGITHMLIGDVQNTMGHADDALSNFRAAQTIAAELAEADPNDRRALQDLGYALERIAYAQLGRRDAAAALESFKRGRDARAAVVATDPQDLEALRNLAISHFQVGDIQLNYLNQSTEAAGSYAEATALCRALLEKNAEDGQARRLLAIGFERLGNLHRVAGNLETALGYFRELLAEAQSLADRDPSNFQAQRDLSVALNKMGKVLGQSDRPAEALGYYLQALELRQRLAEQDPDAIAAKLDVVNSHERIGHLYGVVMERPAEGLQSYLQAVSIREALAAADSKYVVQKSRLALDYARVGRFQLETDQVAAAVQSLRISLELREAVLADAPGDGSALREVVFSIQRLADGLTHLGSIPNEPQSARVEHWATARTLFQRGIELVDTLCARNIIEGDKADDISGSLTERIAECEQAIAALEGALTSPDALGAEATTNP